MRALRSIIVAIVVTVSALGIAPGADAHDDHGPFVAAHRGGAGGDRTQENTLAAFDAAHAAHGAGGVWMEMDTQLTKDGVLIVLHDDRLSQTVNGRPGHPWDPSCNRAAIDLTYDEIVACDPDVPSLSALMAHANAPTRQWRLMIEIKNLPGQANFDPTGTKVASALIELLEEHELLDSDRVIVQSFFPPSLHAAEALAARAGGSIQSMLLTSGAISPAPVGFPATSNGLFSTLTQIDIVAPDVRSLDLSAEAVAAMHAMGKRVVVWTANDATTISRLASWGVDGIITDHPALAYTTLAG